MAEDSAGGVWLTCHKTQLGMQYAVFHDPVHKFLADAVRKERLDTRKDWLTLKAMSLVDKMRTVFGEQTIKR